jgi:hypothetical protein
MYHITALNEFIRESTDAKISSRGITGTEADNIRHYQAEARFLRAYEYWVLLDLVWQPTICYRERPDRQIHPSADKTRRSVHLYRIGTESDRAFIGCCQAE